MSNNHGSWNEECKSRDRASGDERQEMVHLVRDGGSPSCYSIEVRAREEVEQARTVEGLKNRRAAGGE